MKLTELDEVRLAARGATHQIVVMDLAGPEFFKRGWCFLCGRQVVETGDYRQNRFRHLPKIVR